ncbi:hypothetical protein GCM10007962_12280 [Yeosuana aromativorans]|jgi:hypothetical protein|uniref:Uncharacterized protein n=1 Tax=Yeosuana aromativorans TaxID=288019 RepID=A0A8J3FFC1_9FLAO|nr:hypothetical protein GCM10007962_12280 [Yeosuana aromativorans]
MLSDKQSLILCGLLGIGIFSTGVLGVLDNFITKTLLTILFLVIVVNLIVVNSRKKEHKE